MITHPRTEKGLELLITQKPHAVLITGAAGSGKSFLSYTIVKQLSGQENLNNYPYILEIDALTQGSIEAVRGIKDFLLRKTTGDNPLRRFVIVHEAQNLGHEAQNAMLKLLEEPPADTMIILTSSNTTLLLGTILSRVHKTHIYPLNIDQAKSYLNGDIDPKQFVSIYHLSNGQPGLLYSLMSEADHPFKDSIAQAKQLLQMSSFERLSKIETLLKDKDGLDGLLAALERVLKSLFMLSEEKSKINRFQKARERVYATRRALKQNVNAKLLLTQLFLEL